MVRLKARVDIPLKTTVSNFNSTMVRLKAVLILKQLKILYRKDTHYSRIYNTL